MYSTILWASDGGPGASDALDEAVRLLDPGGRLVAFHAKQVFVGSHVSGMPVYPDEPEREDRLAGIVEDLCDRGIDAELLIGLTVHSPARSIAAAAVAVGADVVVCSAAGHHSRLIHETAIPVVVVPQHALAPSS
jgi:nucleotide-binding universal stress UspA family protein